MTYETKKSAVFFYKERKRTQRMPRSFIKNVKECKECSVLFFLKNAKERENARTLRSFEKNACPTQSLPASKQTLQTSLPVSLYFACWLLLVPFLIFGKLCCLNSYVYSRVCFCATFSYCTVHRLFCIFLGSYPTCSANENCTYVHNRLAKNRVK